jgi:type I restriction-modification system DNA methylase subunit
MLHDPIFSPKDFERQKAEIQTLIKRIPNLESRREIVEQWQDAIEYERLSNKKEEDIQAEFLHKFFGEVLGYAYGTHLKEENLRLEASTLYDFTKPDGILGFFPSEEKQAKDVRVVIELKRYGINLDKPQNRVDFKGTPVEQAFSYASKMGSKCQWVIVSDFAEIRLYRYPDMNRYERFHILSLLDDNNFPHFLFLLSKNQLFNREEDVNNLSSLAVTPRLYKGRMDFLEDITNQFYARYKAERESLFNHIRQLNPHYTPARLFTATQKILDRLVFMRFVSEIGLTEQNILKNVYQYSLPHLYDLSEEVAWVSIKSLFNSFDKGYKANIPPFNGGLFAPDEIINELIIKENYLKDWIKFLLDYDFQYDLKVNILGHIFEQSITDIQKLQARNFEPEIEEPSNGLPTNRKQFGVFYTPEYVTQYIVKQTIGNYLEEKKAEILASLGVAEITEIADDFMAWQSEKPSLTIEEVAEIHLQFWQTYKQSLEKITVLDPACGSGAFLNAVFDFLYEKNALVQAEINKLQMPPTPPAPQNKKKKESKKDLFAQAQREQEQKLITEEMQYIIKRDILLTNLYGVDLNEESVEITKLSLWLKVANKKRPLPSLTDNIKLGNSLIDKPEFSPKAFDWAKEFPHIFAAGGFDVVVGNPPYVSFQSNIIPQKEIDYFTEKYQTVYKVFDLFALFIEQSIENLLKNNGGLSFIVPSVLLMNRSFSKLRELICQKASFRNVTFFGDGVFPDAVVPTITFSLLKNKTQKPVKIGKAEKENIVIENQISQSIFCQNPLSGFNISIKESDLQLFIKINKNTTSLGDVLEIRESIKTGDDKKFISNTKKSPLYYPLVTGKDIGRYWLTSNRYILFDESALQRPTKIDYFLQDKLFIRRVGADLIATFDNKNHFSTHVLYLGLQKDEDYELKYLLALINSKLFNYIYKTKFPPKGNIFPEIRIGNLRELPVKVISREEQATYIEIVNKLLINYTENLDQTLDQLIYQLYDLTAEEIALIENAS